MYWKQLQHFGTAFMQRGNYAWRKHGGHEARFHSWKERKVEQDLRGGLVWSSYMNAMYNIFFQQQIYFYLKNFHDLKNLPPSRRKQSSYLGEIQSIKGASAQVMFFVKWYISLLHCYNVASYIHVNAEAMKSISREISFHQYMGMISSWKTFGPV